VKEFQPMNVNFGLFPELDAPLRGKDKRKALAERALRDLEEWIKSSF
jgi:methylenetetrahydrofolate--tRNA-(uracil-5-)-methyltransferase